MIDRITSWWRIHLWRWQHPTEYRQAQQDHRELCNEMDFARWRNRR